MRATVRLCLLLLTLCAAAVSAHTKLGRSVPAEGAEVETPAALVLEFTEPVYLTSVSLQAADGEPGQTGRIPDGPAASYQIPVTATLAAGAYVVRWRAIGADTHIVSGEFGFSVIAAPAAQPGESAATADGPAADR